MESKMGVTVVDQFTCGHQEMAIYRSIYFQNSFFLSSDSLMQLDNCNYNSFSNSPYSISGS